MGHRSKTMTTWTDLIDTDPVGAYHLWIAAAPVASAQDVLSGKERRAEIRLMSNLTALCEELATELGSVTDEDIPYLRKPISRDEVSEVIQDVMRRSRRFPEVK